MPSGVTITGVERNNSRPAASRSRYQASIGAAVLSVGHCGGWVASERAYHAAAEHGYVGLVHGSAP